MEEIKKTFFEKFKRHPRRFQLNMPKKIGVPPAANGPNIILETDNGYTMQVYNQEEKKIDWIGFPKWVIEKNPQLYTEVLKN